MSQLRLFVALSLPPGIRAQLAKQLRVIERDLPPGALSAVVPQNFHITLRFLGEVETEQVEALSQRLEAACQDFSMTSPTLTLSCRGLGVFPNLRQPRVLWVGVVSNGDLLRRLQTGVAAACAPFTSHTEKSPFSPHMTLGRLRHLNGAGRNALTGHLSKSAELDFGSWTATEALLMQSELGNGPARYSVLSRFPLIANLGVGNSVENA